jgi:prepilin-type N-terminal cleavage/methylation domain-containing protein
MLKRQTRAFTLVEIMIVSGIISIIVAIAVPTWLRQREIARARCCQENLSKIAGAKEQYALEFKVANGTTITYPDDLITPPGATVGEGFMKKAPSCPAAGTYTANAIGTDPECSIVSTIIPHELHKVPN